MFKQRQFHIFAAVRGLSYSVVFGIFGVIALAFLFVKLSDDVVEREFGNFDRDIMLSIHTTTTDFQTHAMVIITNFGSPYLATLAVISLLIGGYFYWRSRQSEDVGIGVTVIDTVAPAFTLGGALLLDIIVKTLVGRIRPDVFPPLVAEVGYSFPSGHVMSSIAFYGMCAFLIGRHRNAIQCIGITLITIIIIGAIAYSRIYLGVHYPTDVFGSALLGSAWLLSAIIGLRLIEKHLQAVHQINKEAAKSAQESNENPLQQQSLLPQQSSVAHSNTDSLPLDSPSTVGES